MRDELPGVAVRATAPTGWRRIAAAIACADAQAVAIFCAIGFLATINAVLLFPDFGEAFARLAMLS
jgi:hypothetical protein